MFPTGNAPTINCPDRFGTILQAAGRFCAEPWRVSPSHRGLGRRRSRRVEQRSREGQRENSRSCAPGRRLLTRPGSIASWDNNWEWGTFAGRAEQETTRRPSYPAGTCPEMRTRRRPITYYKRFPCLRDHYAMPSLAGIGKL